MQPVFRFAPSPNGFLHLGHAFSALANEALARRLAGRLLLRIEDIDPQRSRETYVDAIEEDLAWLGLSWERPVLRQSRHMDDYGAAVGSLRRLGLAYRCFCSRGDTARHVAGLEASGPPWPRDPDGVPHHAGPCAGLSLREAADRAAAGEPHVWRLRMGEAVAGLGAPPVVRRWSPDPTGEACDDGQGSLERVPVDPLAWGDVVVARRDVPTSYHVAVVVDDARQQVSHVVRGADLEAATAVHRVLQALLGLPDPVYAHHRLLLDEDGRKLAKSRLSTPLRILRESGTTAQELRSALGFAAVPAAALSPRGSTP